MPSGPAFSVIATVVSNRVGQVTAALQKEVAAAVNETAVELRDWAVTIAPKDTGSLRDSIYVNNGEESDYNLCVARAENDNPDVVILEEIDPEFVISLSGGGKSNDILVVVGVAASHGAPQEFGTRNMRPQPFMRPAILQAEQSLTNKISQIRVL